MAIYNGRILMRKGNEADFDPSKLMSGEWAVSLDAGIVRICLEAGKVIRMATYEAFEEDMKQIEAILLECQSIEEAVRRINTEVSEKLNACAEYVQQAKNYSEQAKTSEANSKSYMQSAKTSEENAKVSEINAKASENSAKEYENSAKLTEERAREVFESIPEDYSTISNDLYELAIKETASGEEIHVNDSSNLKLREFALYGKAKQNTTQGNQLFDWNSNVASKDALTVTAAEDGGIHVNGTPNKQYANIIFKEITLPNGTYTVNGGERVSGKLYAQVTKSTKDGSTLYYATGNNFTVDENTNNIYVSITAGAYTDAIDYTIYPMLNKGTTALPFEPYSGEIPSPNPQYPQPIKVSGASGSVAVKSVGKNKLNFDSLVGLTDNVVRTFEQSIKVEAKKYYPIFLYSDGTEASGTYLSVSLKDANDNTILPYINNYSNTGIDISKENASKITKVVLYSNGSSGKVFDKFYLSSVDREYQPYKETVATIPTANGLAGIKVSSNGNYTDQNGQQWICDEVVKYADGSGESIQRFGTVVFDGSDDEAWQDRTNDYTNKKDGQTRFSIRVDKPYDASREICAMSNIGYQGQIQGSPAFSKEGIALYTLDGTSTSTICYVTLNNPNVTDLATFKAWLSNNNVVLVYELANQIHTPLTAEEIAEIEKLQTFYPITNISNDAECGMKVTYYCDSKNYIGNQLAIMKQEQEEEMANMLMLMPTEVQATMIENDTNDLLKESEI